MPELIQQSLRDGVEFDDPRFDRIYPLGHRLRSAVHWTPVDVARRVCELLALGPHHTVLDVGSGVGKMCLIGALVTDATWVGIERDAAMVSAGARAARLLGLQRRVNFVCGTLDAIDWARFDAFYLFNPFAETLISGPDDALARRRTYIADIEIVQRHLAVARPGTRVVTYHGFGGDMPPELELTWAEAAHEDELRVWTHR